MKKRYSKIIIALIIEIIILFTVFIMILNYSPSTLDVDLSQWQSNHITYEDEQWSVDAGEISKSTIDLIYGPYIEVKKGDYTVDVSYMCDDDQSFKIHAMHGNSSYIKANTFTLDSRYTQISYDFRLTSDIDNLELIVKYSGDGACQISDISIYENNNGLKRAFVCLILLFLLGDAIYIFNGFFKAHKSTICSILGITFFASLPLFIDGLYGGHDGMFHLMRIEGIATELSYGVFPARLQSLWMDGYGYPVSIYYGDLLLYIPALLRLAGFSVTTCFKCYIIFINMGTAVLAFVSFKKIFKRENIALILAFVYATASYRFENLYIREAAGEFTAMMFIPLAAAAIYGIYSDEANDWKTYRKNIIWLTVAMTGLVTCHVLSTQMVCFVLLVVCIVFAKKTFRKNTIRVFLTAIVQTLCICSFFWVPFVDYYINSYVNINDTMNELQNIQSSGVYIAQYFAFWQKINGGDKMAVNERFQMTPGIVLMLTLIVAFVIWYKGKANLKVKTLSVFSLLFLFVASDLFPWNFIEKLPLIGKLLVQVQFPWRYLSIAIIFLVLLLGALLELTDVLTEINVGKYVYIVIACACFIGVASFSSTYFSDLEMRNYYNTLDLNDKRVVNGEYLLVDTDTDLTSDEVLSTNLESVEVLEKLGSYMRISCQVKETEGTVEFPLFNYRGYRISDEYGNEYGITNGTNNRIAVTLPAHFEGIITSQYVEPWYWKVALYFSLLSVLMIGIYEITTIKRRKIITE